MLLKQDKISVTSFLDFDIFQLNKVWLVERERTCNFSQLGNSAANLFAKLNGSNYQLFKDTNSNYFNVQSFMPKMDNLNVTERT